MGVVFRRGSLSGLTCGLRVNVPLPDRLGVLVIIGLSMAPAAAAASGTTSAGAQLRGGSDTARSRREMALAPQSLRGRRSWFSKVTLLAWADEKLDLRLEWRGFLGAAGGLGVILEEEEKRRWRYR